MRLSRRFITLGCLALAVVSSKLPGDPGDVDNSHDYASFPRLPGFVISDYDEDNPADFDFPVAHPLPIDSNHIDMVHVTGHRYVIRYELGAGASPRSLLQTQRYYEKLAAAAGFNLQKSGAVGDVTETFVQQQGNRFVWVYLEPGANMNSLTVMESSIAPPQQAPPPAPPPVVIAQSPAPAPIVKPTPAPVAPPPVAPAPPEPAPEANNANEDSLYTSLIQDGHVALPITFLPGKPDIDADSKPVIDRVVAILKLHPDLKIEIDGHTDNYGSAEQNRYISTQRALTVKGMLIAAHISRKRLSAVGKGGSQPVADNDTAEGREKNRRIELVLRKGTVTKDATTDDSAQNDSSQHASNAFHPAAPNGQNYYPSANNSASEADSSR